MNNERINTSHIVIDLETLSTKHNAAVASIGIAVVGADLKGEFILMDSRYIKVDLSDYDETTGFDISAGTFQWWLGQSDEARAELSGAQDGCLDTFAAADEVFDLIAPLRDQGPIRVWGNGATFDVTIMEHFLKEGCVDVPWKYTDVRCLRTIFDHEGIDWKAHLPTNGAHNASHDAMAEALGLCDALNVANSRGVISQTKIA